jgi:hypothetical protein
MARTHMRGESCRLQLPVLEDMHAVQIALTQVLDGLADDRIDPKRAGLMLYALQQAATNLNSTPGWKGTREQVEYTQPMRALEVPDVATQYDLPKGVDLELPPEAALQAAEQLLDSRQKPKEHVRLARMPELEAAEIDNYYHIPKDPDAELSFDEMSYALNRMKKDLCGGTQEPAADPESAAPPRPAASACAIVNGIPATADVA